MCVSQVAQAGPNLSVLLPLPAKCWDSMSVPHTSPTASWLPFSLLYWPRFCSDRRWPSTREAWVIEAGGWWSKVTSPGASHWFVFPWKMLSLSSLPAGHSLELSSAAPQPLRSRLPWQLSSQACSRARLYRLQGAVSSINGSPGFCRVHSQTPAPGSQLGTWQGPDCYLS